MKELFLSIIIPVYNVAKYLPMCLDSCLAQDIDDYEIICVNDGSTDNSLEILNEYAKKSDKIKVFSQENSGVSTARNLGMEKSIGEWLWFVDSDDMIRENCLLEIKNKVNGVYFYDFTFKRVPESFTGKNDYEKIEAVNSEKMLANVFSKIYKRSLLLENNVNFSKELSYAEDAIFNIKYYLLFNGTSEIKGDGFYFYRESLTSVSRFINVKKILSSMFYAMQYLVKEFDGLKYPIVIWNFYYFYNFLLEHLLSCPYCKTKKYLKNLKENGFYETFIETEKYRTDEFVNSKYFVLQADGRVVFNKKTFYADYRKDYFRNCVKRFKIFCYRLKNKIKKK